MVKKRRREIASTFLLQNQCRIHQHFLYDVVKHRLYFRLAIFGDRGYLLPSIFRGCATVKDSLIIGIKIQYYAFHPHISKPTSEEPDLYYGINQTGF